MYTYQAHVTKVHDGDTLTCDIDLGFNILYKDQKIRLYGINAPEIIGPTKPQGTASRDALRELVLDKDIIIATRKDDKEKYGRYLGIISVGDENINDWLVKNKLAVVYLLT